MMHHGLTALTLTFILGAPAFADGDETPPEAPADSSSPSVKKFRAGPICCHFFCPAIV